MIGNLFEKIARAIAKLYRRKSPPEWYLRNQRDEEYTQKLLHKILKNDSNCIDIGAHKGRYLKHFTQCAPEGQHYAFEPLPDLAEALMQNFPNIKVFKCALSDKSGKATFHRVPGSGAMSGLRELHYPKKGKPIKFEVEVKRLDDIIGDKMQVDFIKADAEGAELEVLKGSEFTIKRCLPIILFHFAKLHCQSYGTTPDKIYNFLTETCNFEVLELVMSKTLTNEQFGEIYESSFASNYDKNAQTRFIARPRSTS